MPLATTLPTNGPALLFLLWYVTRALHLFERQRPGAGRTLRQ